MLSPVRSETMISRHADVIGGQVEPAKVGPLQIEPELEVRILLARVHRAVESEDDV